MTTASGLPISAEIGVIGAGAMGAGIAQIAAQAGHRVHLFDTRMGAADEAQVRIGATLAALAAKGKLDATAAAAAAGRVIPVHALGDLVSAKLVVEAVVEDLEVKRQLLRELEVVVTPETILASNTSSISITALAAGMKHPGRVIGMHFFNPAPVMPLVEVVRGLATDAQVLAITYATAAAWGKQPVHAESTPGFIVNRCARPFYGEALRLYTERAADPATIDAVMREAGGFRMGPFELMDLVGLDVNLAVTRSVWEAYFHDPRFAPSVAQQELVAAGYLGRKSGRGFFDYTPGVSRLDAQTEAPQPRPDTIRAAGDGAMIEALRDRLVASGFNVAPIPVDHAVAEAYLDVAGTLLVPSDGRTATTIVAACAHADVVVFDLALAYANCTRLAIAAADSCSPAGAAAAIGALQAAGIAVTRVDDVAGLVVLRTVAMLANEAADAVTQGIAAPADVDLAMRKGVNYPCGPLAWADAIGLKRVRAVLQHLAAHYGEDRYRVSPLITRRCAAGGKLGQ
ncbi:MAG: 3-hydroxyacyl-CoA dehydrogenase [Betaproteobacteria bacterium]